MASGSAMKKKNVPKIDGDQQLFKESPGYKCVTGNRTLAVSSLLTGYE
jgi:hypothetical protein